MCVIHPFLLINAFGGSVMEIYSLRSDGPKRADCCSANVHVRLPA